MWFINKLLLYSGSSLETVIHYRACNNIQYQTTLSNGKTTLSTIFTKQKTLETKNMSSILRKERKYERRRSKSKKDMIKSFQKNNKHELPGFLSNLKTISIIIQLIMSSFSFDVKLLPGNTNSCYRVKLFSGSLKSGNVDYRTYHFSWWQSP